jgi:biopolymer transport protein ExbB
VVLLRARLGCVQRPPPSKVRRMTCRRFGFVGLIAQSFAALLVAATPLSAHAWWNAEFKQRTKITLNTSAAGVTTSEALSGVAVPIRLHSGNFDFITAKPDGSDLRVVAGDDKTPLKFSVERFDGANELGVLWVQVPTVAPGSDKNFVYVYAGNAKVAAEPASPVVDSGAALTLRFDQADGQARDAAGLVTVSKPVAIETNGLIGASARFDGAQTLELPANDKLKAASGAAYSLSFWARPAVVAGTLFSQGPLSLALDKNKVSVKLGKLAFEGGDLPAGTWVHIALTLGTGKATLYVNGAQAAQADVAAGAPATSLATSLAIEGPIRMGAGFSGLIDEVQVATVTRSAEWIKFTRAAQGADAKLVAAQLEREGEAAAGEPAHGGYIGVLVKNLTVDAWVVIGILGVMFVISVWVMIVKGIMVTRTDGGNHKFLKVFRDAPDVLKVDGASHTNASLARLYDAGAAQLRKRNVGDAGAKPLSGASIDAVKAAIDADLVRENHRLNSLMVLLTIAISGGPFLGLLGTVVGVMITFAAIAAAGDVNVNAIAPGIAAALLATVAGLGVAIPALFGYNYLASKIKNISTDMQIFVDEFVTRVAERYGQP